MSVSGRDWEVALGRLTRARFKAAAGLQMIELAQGQLVAGDDDSTVYDACRSAQQELDMACALLRDLGVSRGLKAT